MTARQEFVHTRVWREELEVGNPLAARAAQADLLEALAVSEASIYGGRARVWVHDYFVRVTAWVYGGRPLHDLIDFERAPCRKGPRLMDVRIDGEEMSPMCLHIRTQGAER
ncbi:MAG: hypothetical protein JO142_02560 [Burkholderiales bacterium]|nr:hypothetical protein [Burkholderiales bacterium]